MEASAPLRCFVLSAQPANAALLHVAAPGGEAGFAGGFVLGAAFAWQAVDDFGGAHQRASETLVRLRDPIETVAGVTDRRCFNASAIMIGVAPHRMMPNRQSPEATSRAATSPCFG